MEKDKRPTEAQIKEWKSKYEDVYELEHLDKLCYIHDPSRETMSLALSKARDPLEMVEALIKNCWLVGDEEFKTDKNYIGGLIEQSQRILGFKEIKLKKL